MKGGQAVSGKAETAQTRKPSAAKQSRELRYGTQGEDVTRLQAMLAARGYDAKPTGIYDMDTVTAVRAAQVATGRPQNGIVRADDAKAFAAIKTK